MTTQGERRRGLGSTYRTLSTTNPFVFLMFYVLLIPLFAFGYWVLANSHNDKDFKNQDFYAPYARREAGALADKAAVETNLQAALVHALQANLPSHPDWAVDGLHAYALNLPTEGEPPENGPAVFTVYISARHLEDGGVVGSGGPYTFSLDLHTDSFPKVVCHPASPPTLPAIVARHDFAFDLVLTPPTPWRMARSICWTINAETRLQRLAAGWRGDPRAFSDFPARMLYFSATTITTTGFGDIVPLSGPARALTGLEAALGWMVAGLFLNAVAWRAGKLIE